MFKINQMNNIYKKAAKVIKKADALLIGAGAGIGVDSGLPDFRGKQGFWRAYPVIEKLGISFENMANPYWFKEKPRLAWAFYGHRFNMYKKTTPHKGFQFLLDIAKSMKNSYFVYTSNVDGHFQKAGFNENNIYEIHGSINHLQCSSPCNQDIWNPDFDEIKIDEKKFEAIGQLPVCKKCNKLARPNVLMFGDWLWVQNRSAKQSNNYHDWISEMWRKKSKFAIIEIGAGSALPSVRLNSQKIARKFKGGLIRINPRENDVPEGEIGIKEGGLKALENIVSYL